MTKHSRARARLLLTEREGEAVKLAKEGKTVDQVAAELGVGHATAHRYIKAGRERAQKLTAELAKAHMIEFVQDCQEIRQHWKKFLNDSDPTVACKAAERVESAGLSVAKMLGVLPAPGAPNRFIEEAAGAVHEGIRVEFKESPYKALADGSTIDTRTNEVVDPPDAPSEHWDGGPVKKWPHNIARPKLPVPPPAAEADLTAERYALATGRPVNGSGAVFNAPRNTGIQPNAQRSDTQGYTQSWTLEKGNEAAAKRAELAAKAMEKKRSWMA